MIDHVLKSISDKCKQAKKDLDIVYTYLNEKQKGWKKFKRHKVIKPLWMVRILKKDK